MFLWRKPDLMVKNPEEKVAIPAEATAVYTAKINLSKRESGSKQNETCQYQ